MAATSKTIVEKVIHYSNHSSSPLKSNIRIWTLDQDNPFRCNFHQFLTVLRSIFKNSFHKLNQIFKNFRFLWFLLHVPKNDFIIISCYSVSSFTWFSYIQDLLLNSIPRVLCLERYGGLSVRFAKIYNRYRLLIRYHSIRLEIT